MNDQRIALPPGSQLILKDPHTGASRSFRILEECGRGGSCIVYRGILFQDPKISRPVLLKEFYPLDFGPYFTREPQSGSLVWVCKAAMTQEVQRYEQEKSQFLKVIGMQQHFYLEHSRTAADELVEIQEVLSSGAGCCAVLSCGSGVSWDQTDPWEESLYDILQTLLSVISEVRRYHESGYLYCDLKPANIYLFRKTRQHIRLLDFGSVQKLSCGRLTGRETLSYTIGYCAPEVLNTRDLDPIDRPDYYACITPKSDVYSIAAILLEKVTGQQNDPFRSDYLQQLDDVWNQRISFRNIRRSAFLALERPLRMGLEPDPNLRCSLAELEAELLGLLPLFQEHPYVIHPDCRLSGINVPFLGRTEELCHLESHLHQGAHTIFVTGEAGIGKTALVRKLAQQMSDRYDFYIIPYQQNFRQTILSIPTEPMHPLEAEGASSNSVQDILYQHKLACLRSYSRQTVLVIDHVEIPPQQESAEFHSQAYQDLMNLNARLLFTTSASCSDAVCVQHLPPLPCDVLFSLMQSHYSGSLPEKTALQLIEQMYQNTLLVVLLAKTLEQSWGALTPETACRILETSENKSKLLTSPLHKLLNLSRLDPASRELLAHGALFPSEGLSSMLCLACYCDTMQDKLRLLELRGWIQKTNRNRLQIPALIQEALIADLAPWEDSCKKFLQSYELAVIALPVAQRSAHRSSLAALYSNGVKMLSDADGTYTQRAALLNYEAGHYLTALEHNQTLWEMLRCRQDLDPHRALELLNRTAVCHSAIGDYQNAVMLLSQAIHVFQTLAPGQITEHLGEAYENLGNFYQAQRDDSRALVAYRKAEELYRELAYTPGLSHLRLNLCKIFEKLGLWEDALEMGRQARSDLGPPPYDPNTALLVASVCTTMGILEERREHYEEALGYHQQALVICNTLYGPNHPETIDRLNSKGIILSYLHQYTPAMEALTEALRRKEAAPDTPGDSLANTYHSIADLCRIQGDLTNGLAWCEKAESLRIQLFGSKSFQAASSYELHSAILYQQEAYDEALEYSTLAFMILFDLEAITKPAGGSRRVHQAFLRLKLCFSATGRPISQLPEWLHSKNGPCC